MSTLSSADRNPDRMAYDGQAERIILRTVVATWPSWREHIDYATPRWALAKRDR